MLGRIHVVFQEQTLFLTGKMLPNFLSIKLPMYHLPRFYGSQILPIKPHVVHSPWPKIAICFPNPHRPCLNLHSCWQSHHICSLGRSFFFTTHGCSFDQLLIFIDCSRTSLCLMIQITNCLLENSAFTIHILHSPRVLDPQMFLFADAKPKTTHF